MKSRARWVRFGVTRVRPPERTNLDNAVSDAEFPASELVIPQRLVDLKAHEARASE